MSCNCEERRIWAESFEESNGRRISDFESCGCRNNERIRDDNFEDRCRRREDSDEALENAELSRWPWCNHCCRCCHNCDCCRCCNRRRLV